MTALETPRAVCAGLFALGLMMGLAVGNGWTTAAALQGSGHWWQQYCRQQVQKHVQLQEKLDNQ